MSETMLNHQKFNINSKKSKKYFSHFDARPQNAIPQTLKKKSKIFIQTLYKVMYINGTKSF